MNPEDIKVIKEQSPFLFRIVSAGMHPQPDTLFPCSPVIYNPSGLPIPQDIMIHEVVHIAQQGNNPTGWWQKYITDKRFRFTQELEANQVQYKFVCKVLKDKNQQARSLLAIAKNMAGEVYNLNISVNKIMEMVKNG